MTNNQYQFMLRTGKYYPEDIQFDGEMFYVMLFNENDDCTYYENSKGFWYKQEYNEYGLKTYFENSDGFKIKRDDSINPHKVFSDDYYII